MKNAILLALATFLIASLATVSPAATAAEKPDKATRQAERLKKYDKDGDGKLSETEKAVMKEDLKKQKGAKKETKKGSEPAPGEKK